MALFEKNFGMEVEKETFINTDDLMSLQITEDILIEGVASCSLCTWTCWATSAQYQP
jgi:hypothetical protein